MKKTIIASAVVGVFALSGAISVANANLLTIVNGSPEAIGDPGGTNYANGPTAGASAGPGMPTDLGGWPNAPGFAPDPSFGNNLGISGWDGSYLKLEQAGDVTFQFMGKGDATDNDIFQLYYNNGTSLDWHTLWDNQSSANGTCGVTGTTPDCVFSGSVFTTFINPFLYPGENGLIAFRFQNLTNPATAVNYDPITGLSNNPKDSAPGYFLGVDPYLASGPYQRSGTAVYAGFTDRPPPGDHDYEDLVVRMSVPEPGSLILLMLGLLGFGALRRLRPAASDSEGLLA